MPFVGSRSWWRLLYSPVPEEIPATSFFSPKLVLHLFPPNRRSPPPSVHPIRRSFLIFLCAESGPIPELTTFSLRPLSFQRSRSSFPFPVRSHAVAETVDTHALFDPSLRSRNLSRKSRVTSLFSLPLPFPATGNTGSFFVLKRQSRSLFPLAYAASDWPPSSRHYLSRLPADLFPGMGCFYLSSETGSPSALRIMAPPFAAPISFFPPPSQTQITAERHPSLFSFDRLYAAWPPSDGYQA